MINKKTDGKVYDEIEKKTHLKWLGLKQEIIYNEV